MPAVAASAVLIRRHDVVRSEDERYVQPFERPAVDVRCQTFPARCTASSR